jgi:RHS repeat-associated protein
VQRPGVYNLSYNYTYDPSGNLRSDAKNQITGVTYTRNNLTASVNTGAGKTLTNLYDVNDGRIYNEDAADNEKQIYLKDFSGKDIGIVGLNGWEFPVYGHDRIATVNDAGISYYEYDHLGGVRTTYSVASVNCPGTNPQPSYSFNYISDYYAFGKILRSYVPSVLDRYGYQGCEREKRISDNNYSTHYRELDSDIGRWWSVDPKMKYSETAYSIFANNPILNTDPRGDVVGGDKDKKPGTPAASGSSSGGAASVTPSGGATITPSGGAGSYSYSTTTYATGKPTAPAPAGENKSSGKIVETGAALAEAADFAYGITEKTNAPPVSSPTKLSFSKALPGIGLNILSAGFGFAQIYSQYKEGGLKNVNPVDATSVGLTTAGVAAKTFSLFGMGGAAATGVATATGIGGMAITAGQLWYQLYKPIFDMQQYNTPTTNNPDQVINQNTLANAPPGF